MQAKAFALIANISAELHEVSPALALMVTTDLSSAANAFGGARLAKRTIDIFCPNIVTMDR